MSKLGRNILKAKYAAFVTAWNNEKTLQRITLADGKELPEGQQILGPKPPFSVWVKAYRSGALTPRPPVQDSKVSVADTSWDDDNTQKVDSTQVHATESVA